MKLYTRLRERYKRYTKTQWLTFSLHLACGVAITAAITQFVRRFVLPINYSRIESTYLAVADIADTHQFLVDKLANTPTLQTNVNILQAENALAAARNTLTFSQRQLAVYVEQENNLETLTRQDITTLREIQRAIKGAIKWVEQGLESINTTTNIRDIKDRMRATLDSLNTATTTITDILTH